MYNPMFNSYGYPNMNQPYNYQANPYMNNYQNNLQQAQPVNTNTNKIYVSGIEDVRNTRLLPNSDMIYIDNDKPLLYQKVVDGKGQFEVKSFKIIPYSPEQDTKKETSIDLSGYVEKGEFDALKQEFEAFKNKSTIKKVEVVNGTTGNGTNKSI